MHGSLVSLCPVIMVLFQHTLACLAGGILIVSCKCISVVFYYVCTTHEARAVVECASYMYVPQFHQDTRT